MSEQGILFIIAGAVACGIFCYHRTTLRLTALHGDELRAYNAGAFTPIVEESGNENFSYVTRLAIEVESRKGQRAILLQTAQWGGMVVHHINKNGTFSAKGPYFVSARQSNWHATGNIHLIKVLRGKGSHGFPPDHYDQRGQICEKGLAILEDNTRKYPPIADIRRFAERKAQR